MKAEENFTFQLELGRFEDFLGRGNSRSVDVGILEVGLQSVALESSK